MLEDTFFFFCCRCAAPWRQLSLGPRRCPASSSRDRHPQACDSLSVSAVLLVQKIEGSLRCDTTFFLGKVVREPGALCLVPVSAFI